MKSKTKPSSAEARLNVTLPTELHTLVKVRAAERHLSMREYVIAHLALFEPVANVVMREATLQATEDAQIRVSIDQHERYLTPSAAQAFANDLLAAAKRAIAQRAHRSDRTKPSRRPR